MRILLDTHILIWGLTEPSRLSAAIRSELERPSNQVFFSPINLLEIAIKFGARRPDFRRRPEELLDAALNTGLEELPLQAWMTLGVATLPRIHTDPFDRLLIAQASATQCRLFTRDAAVLAYGEPTSPA